MTYALLHVRQEINKQHLKQVFRRWFYHNLTVLMQKGKFSFSQSSFLFNEISTQDIKLLPRRTQKLGTVKKCQMFLSWSIFADDAIETQRLSLNMHPGNRKNGRPRLNWPNDAISFFKKWKKELSDIALLALPGKNIEVHLWEDACNVPAGIALYQVVAGHFQHLAFVSKKFKNALLCVRSGADTERADREDLAIHHFKFILEAVIEKFKSFTLVVVP